MWNSLWQTMIKPRIWSRRGTGWETSEKMATKMLLSLLLHCFYVTTASMPGGKFIFNILMNDKVITLTVQWSLMTNICVSNTDVCHGRPWQTSLEFIFITSRLLTWDFILPGELDVKRIKIVHFAITM